MCVFVLLPNHKVAFKNGPLLLADEVVWLDVQLPGAGKHGTFAAEELWAAEGEQEAVWWVWAAGCATWICRAMLWAVLQKQHLGHKVVRWACDLLGIALAGPGYVQHQQHKIAAEMLYLLPLPLLTEVLFP